MGIGREQEAGGGGGKQVGQKGQDRKKSRVRTKERQKSERNDRQRADEVTDDWDAVQSCLHVPRRTREPTLARNLVLHVQGVKHDSRQVVRVPEIEVVVSLNSVARRTVQRGTRGRASARSGWIRDKGRGEANWKPSGGQGRPSGVARD